MPHETFHQCSNQKYLNLETSRQSGTPVATPMWCAEHQGLLSVYSRAEAGKVKRLRRDPRVRVVPCTARGTPEETGCAAPHTSEKSRRHASGISACTPSTAG